MEHSPANDDSSASPGALRRSGGLWWHLRAMRYRRLHGPFRRAIAGFLGDWAPGSAELIIVGPSAGWCLPRQFLLRFSRLVLIDLDTSAPFFFSVRHAGSLRHGGVRIEWRHEDFVRCLPEALSDRPSAAILFCNVLGQLALERDDYERCLALLPGWLTGRSWASFHDRFSAILPPFNGSGDPRPFVSDSPMDAVMLRHLAYGGEWTDHGTGGVLPEGTVRHYLPWRIIPERFHWIEAGSVK